MTIAELANVITAAGMLVSALASVGAVMISWRNGRKIDAVHHSTDGLAERSEAMARKLGVEDGKKQERANPSG